MEKIKADGGLVKTLSSVHTSTFNVCLLKILGLLFHFLMFILSLGNHTIVEYAYNVIMNSLNSTTAVIFDTFHMNCTVCMNIVGTLCLLYVNVNTVTNR